jgi:hypothetical protein
MSLKRSECARALAGLFMSSLLAQVAVARAQPSSSGAGPIAVALEYSAPPDCPNEAEFRGRVERSSARLRWSATAEATRAYRVLIERKRRGFEGQLYEASKAAPRVLSVAACEELVDALSLMLALSADVLLVSTPTADPPAADARVEGEQPPAVAEPEAAVPPPSRAPIGPANSVRPLPPRQQVRGRKLLGLSALALFKAAPDTLFGLAFSYERALLPVVSLRLEARAALGRARADEKYGGVAPAVCLRLERAFAELVGCGGLMLGYLDVQGVEYSGGKQSRYCLAPLLGLKLRAFVVGGLSLEIGAELEHAFIKRSYTLKRDGSSFETPAVSEVFQLGAGARF